MFIVYLGLAVYEMKSEKAKKMSYLDIQEKKGEGIVDHNLIEVKDHQHLPSKPFDKRILKASLAFAAWNNWDSIRSRAIYTLFKRLFYGSWCFSNCTCRHY